MTQGEMKHQRREGKASVRDTIIARAGGMRQGGLSPDEVHETPDFESSESMLDKRGYAERRIAPRYRKDKKYIKN